MLQRGSTNAAYLEKKESGTQVSVCREVANLRENTRSGTGS